MGKDERHLLRTFLGPVWKRQREGALSVVEEVSAKAHQGENGIAGSSSAEIKNGGDRDRCSKEERERVCCHGRGTKDRQEQLSHRSVRRDKGGGGW